MSCRVAVERQHRRHHQGNLFRVRLDITVPGREIVVGRESKPGRAHQDISVAIRDARCAAHLFGEPIFCSMNLSSSTRVPAETKS
jgi:hypothetical protein